MSETLVDVVAKAIVEQLNKLPQEHSPWVVRQEDAERPEHRRIIELPCQQTADGMVPALVLLHLPAASKFKVVGSYPSLMTEAGVKVGLPMWLPSGLELPEACVRDNRPPEQIAREVVRRILVPYLRCYRMAVAEKTLHLERKKIQDDIRDRLVAAAAGRTQGARVLLEGQLQGVAVPTHEHTVSLEVHGLGVNHAVNLLSATREGGHVLLDLFPGEAQALLLLLRQWHPSLVDSLLVKRSLLQRLTDAMLEVKEDNDRRLTLALEHDRRLARKADGEEHKNPENLP